MANSNIITLPIPGFEPTAFWTQIFSPLSYMLANVLFQCMKLKKGIIEKNRWETPLFKTGGLVHETTTRQIVQYVKSMVWRCQPRAGPRQTVRHTASTQTHVCPSEASAFWQPWAGSTCGSTVGGGKAVSSGRSSLPSPSRGDLRLAVSWHRYQPLEPAGKRQHVILG